MRKQFLCFVCLLSMTTVGFAQNTSQPGNAQELARLKSQLSTIQTQLQTEKAARQKAEQSLQEAAAKLSYQSGSAEMQRELKKAQADRDVAVQMYSELQTKMTKMQNIYPIIITKIELGNDSDDGALIDDFGNTLYSSRMRYLTPKIYYTSLLGQSSKMTLFTKIINPDGTVKYGASSPKPYSYLNEVNIYNGENQELRLSGWGNKDSSSYPSGSYRVEIWYGNVCLGQATVVIR